MEPLSSFAINIAAGIALNIWGEKSNPVDKEIKVAFNDTLKRWSKNEFIRHKFKSTLRKQLDEFIYSQNLTEAKEKEFQIFVDIFKKELAKYALAFNYLKEITDGKRYSQIIKEFAEQKKYLSEILENVKYDPRDFSEKLDLLPFNKGRKTVVKKITSLYDIREIDNKLKDSLMIVVDKIYKRTNELQDEINYLKGLGNDKFARVLENIKTAIEKRNPDILSKIKDNYLIKKNEEYIKLLKELIDSAIIIFAYKKAIEFYEDLIEISPVAIHHFEYAYFLQKFNFIDSAIKNYQEALKVYRELANKNPRTYLPYVATTLNNLAVLHSDKNEFPQALEKYEEALKIYRKLAKENPRTYLPDVAMTLNNLANLQKAKNEFPQHWKNTKKP